MRRTGQRCIDMRQPHINIFPIPFLDVVCILEQSVVGSPPSGCMRTHSWESVGDFPGIQRYGEVYRGGSSIL